jgi:2-isopropylmalate synthase
MGTNDERLSVKEGRGLQQSPGWATSPYNRLASEEILPQQIIIQDCTLREAEQSRDINLAVEEKVKIARLLANIGVPEVEFGFPGSSPADIELCQNIRKHNINIKLDACVLIFGDDWKEQIDRAVESYPDVMNITFPSSDIRFEKVLKITRSQAVERCKQAIDYAVNKVAGKDIKVGYYPSDTTRANWDFLEEAIKTAVRHGAQRLTVVDTVGCALPRAVKYLVKKVRALIGDSIPIRIHCHNDYGLGLANTLAGVEGGATIINCSINGVGERNGIAGLAELIAALEFLYGIRTGIELSSIYEVTEGFVRITHLDTPPDQAIVGAYAFCHKLDEHVPGVLSLPEVYETISADVVGAKRIFALGKYSGPNMVSYKGKELGINIPKNRIEDVVKEIRKRSIKEKKALSDEIFKEIVQCVINNKKY